MVSPQSIKDARAYKILRSRDNAYRSHDEHKHKTADERAAMFDQLKEKIRKEGFDPRMPITIQLRRKGRKHDQIRDGHHRFAVAMELGLEEVPVRFLFDPKQWQ